MTAKLDSEQGVRDDLGHVLKEIRSRLNLLASADVSPADRRLLYDEVRALESARVTLEGKLRELRSQSDEAWTRQLQRARGSRLQL